MLVYDDLGVTVVQLADVSDVLIWSVNFEADKNIAQQKFT